MNTTPAIAAHTPGPWAYYDACEEGITAGDMLHPFAVSGPHPERPGCKCTFAFVDGFSHAQAEATARLIAAAPELLAACKALVLRSETIYAPGTKEPAYVTAARTAIAKAEGSK